MNVTSKISFAEDYSASELQEMLYFQKKNTYFCVWLLWIVFGSKIVVILEKSNFVQNCPILAGFIQF